MVVFGGGEKAEYIGAFRVLQDSYSGKLVEVDLAVDFVFLLVFVGRKTVATEDKPTAFPVLDNWSVSRVKRGTDGTTFVLRFLLVSQPLLITLSIWKDPSCSTATGAVFVRMRNCGGCSRLANALMGIAGDIGERTSAVDMIVDGAAGRLRTTVVRLVGRCSCPDGEKGRSVEEPEEGKNI